MQRLISYVQAQWKYWRYYWPFYSALETNLEILGVLSATFPPIFRNIRGAIAPPLPPVPPALRAKQKIDFFQFFQKQNRILLFEYFTYMKNLIFWATSSWCSSKIEFIERGSKAGIVAYERPSHFIKFLATLKWCSSKDHTFYVCIGFKS